MQTTDQEGRIQVPDTVHERLEDDFVFEERGDIAIKGKGLMHTWYLVGRRKGAASVEVDAPVREQVDVLGQ
jgi:adenylate cyclase